MLPLEILFNALKPECLKYLNENGRYGIPFNKIYTKINPEGIPLSELLSNKEIIEILTKQE